MPLVLHCLPKEQQTVAELNKVKCPFQFLSLAKCSSLNEAVVFLFLFSQAQLI